MLEEDVHLGDRFAINDAEVVVTQPRLPCYKLGVRFQADEMVKKFLASRRIGFYVAVTREGNVAAGDEIIPVVQNASSDLHRGFLCDCSWRNHLTMRIGRHCKNCTLCLRSPTIGNTISTSALPVEHGV